MMLKHYSVHWIISSANVLDDVVLPQDDFFRLITKVKRENWHTYGVDIILNSFLFVQQILFFVVDASNLCWKNYQWGHIFWTFNVKNKFVLPTVYLNTLRCWWHPISMFDNHPATLVEVCKFRENNGAFQMIVLSWCPTMILETGILKLSLNYRSVIIVKTVWKIKFWNENSRDRNRVLCNTNNLLFEDWLFYKSNSAD